MTRLHVNGETALSAELYAPHGGVWWADVAMEGAPDLTGRVNLAIDELTFHGTVDPRGSGAFAERGQLRIVGGARGWGRSLRPQHYHSDSGVRARTVAEDAARLADEQLGTFALDGAMLGTRYTRTAAPASRVLKDILRHTQTDATWWVDREGVTHVGTRSAGRIPEDAYDVLDASPSDGAYVLAPRRLAELQVGRTLVVAGESFVIGALQFAFTPEADRVRVWRVPEGNRLATAFRALVEKTTGARLFGRYRYRVVRSRGTRLELQAVAPGLGTPDVLPVAMRPGVAGAHSVPSLGSVVLVEFVEGDRTQPIVSAFAGKGDAQMDAAHPAEFIEFSATMFIRLGSDTASEGVPLGTSLKAWADEHTHLPGTFQAPSSGGPVTGLSGKPTTASPAPSSKVRVE